ncbi:FAD-dependent oxidoreductase, partial [Thermodesulfobacteriota bacterium]
MDIARTINCDVLVVGGGNAGLIAAIEAKNRGASVTLIEKGPKESRGGNSRFSGGTFRIAFDDEKDILPLFEGSNLRWEEIEIEPFTRDDFFNSIMRVTKGLAAKNLTEIYINGSLETAIWIKKQGIEWALNYEHGFKKDGNYIWPKGTNFLMNPGSGEGLVEQEYSILDKLGVDVLYKTAARSL